ncbi:MAG: C40 family peptidase [Desulfotignum sp.]|nr:NlpC/P60 family protein [Desulfobacteraceae bacterium]
MKTSHVTLTFGLLLANLIFSNGYCEKPLVETTVESPHDLSGLDDQILQEVFKHIGVRYKRGGSTKSGMDCSGFVRLVYRHIFHVDLPYVAASQSRLSIFNDIPFEGLRTGDLIYFSRTPKKEKINHVGIYLADGDFAHAIEAKGVTVSSLSMPHWKVRVKKIKRINKSTYQY